MNLTFNLSIINNCTLLINGTTQQYSEYLPETSSDYVQLGRFKYSDTYTINVVNYKSSTDTTLLNTSINSHKYEDTVAYIDETEFPLTKDGHYVIDHLVIPGIEWYNEHKESQILQEYTAAYFTDGNIIYKVQDNQLVQCPIEEIIEINTDGTTISKASQETFSICLLHKCYLTMCNNQFNSLKSIKCINKQDYKNFDLDLVWMALNAIKYNVEFGYLQQAQSILEDVTNCANVCKQTIKSNTSYGCQCGC